MRRSAFFLLVALIALSAASTYWLAEDRREQTLATLMAFACVQGGLLTVFAAALHYVILQANATAPAQLPGALFVAVLLALLAAMAAWTIALYVRFRRVDESARRGRECCRRG